MIRRRLECVVARKRGGSVGTHGELPDLEFLGGNSLVVGLNDRDFVQKPIRPTVLGNVLRPVGVENIAVDPVPIPVFTAGELRESSAPIGKTRLPP